MAADIRLAADDIKIGFNQVTLEIMPAWGGAERLVALVGYSKALLLAGTGTILDAAEAERSRPGRPGVPARVLRRRLARDRQGTGQPPRRRDQARDARGHHHRGGRGLCAAVGFRRALGRRGQGDEARQVVPTARSRLYADGVSCRPSASAGSRESGCAVHRRGVWMNRVRASVSSEISMTVRGAVRRLDVGESHAEPSPPDQTTGQPASLDRFIVASKSVCPIGQLVIARAVGREELGEDARRVVLLLDQLDLQLAAVGQRQRQRGLTRFAAIERCIGSPRMTNHGPTPSSSQLAIAWSRSVTT